MDKLELNPKIELLPEITILLHPLIYERGLVILGNFKEKIGPEKIEVFKKTLQKEGFTISTNENNDLLISHSLFSDRENTLSNKLDLKICTIIGNIFGKDSQLKFVSGRETLE